MYKNHYVYAYFFQKCMQYVILCFQNVCKTFLRIHNLWNPKSHESTTLFDLPLWEAGCLWRLESIKPNKKNRTVTYASHLVHTNTIPDKTLWKTLLWPGNHYIYTKHLALTIIKYCILTNLFKHEYIQMMFYSH